MAMYNFTNVPKHMCNTTGDGRNIKHQLLIEGGVKALPRTILGSGSALSNGVYLLSKEYS
jgi:hypothetical protein